jgi:hypothetical protein
MSLGVGSKTVETLETNNLAPCGVVKADAVFENWQYFPYSTISHHGTMCCEMAREWIYAMDFSQLNGGNPLTGPRWLRLRYNWGPTKYPIHWCEAIEQKTLDCGAHAALSREVFNARGVRSFPAQLVQQFSKNATSQWQLKWDENDTSTHWIKEDVIYHEGCAVLTGENEIKVWDSSAGWWINTKQNKGYGSLLALRIFANQKDAAGTFRWGNHLIKPNEWQKIEAV